MRPFDWQTPPANNTIDRMRRKPRANNTLMMARQRWANLDALIFLSGLEREYFAASHPHRFGRKGDLFKAATDPNHTEQTRDQHDHRCGLGHGGVRTALAVTAFMRNTAFIGQTRTCDAKQCHKQ